MMVSSTNKITAYLGSVGIGLTRALGGLIIREFEQELILQVPSAAASWHASDPIF